MRQLIVTEFLSLDGVMQAPGGPDEDRDGGFPYGGWQRQFDFDETQMGKLMEGIQTTDTYLFGRKTYDKMAEHWPNQPETDLFASVLNPRQKYVVSRTLKEPLPWQNSNLIKDNVVERIRELKNQDGGNITVLGSGELVQLLIKNGLVDMLSLTVHPIVLGTGKRLFRDGLDLQKWELVDALPGKEALMLSYRPAA